MTEPGRTTAFDPDGPAAKEARIFGLADPPENARVVLVPVPFEVTTSYGGGTADGPAAIRKASAQVDLFDIETGSPYTAGIAVLDEDPAVRDWNDEARPLAAAVIEAGGDVGSDSALGQALQRVNEVCVALNERVEHDVTRWLERGKLVGLVGGDHAAAYGAIAAHAKRFPGLGILHVDAHADLRHAYEGFVWSHASIMWNVIERLPQVERLVQVGIRDLCEAELQTIRDSGGRVVTFFDAELAHERFTGTTWGEQVRRIVGALPANVYVSFDIDGLDPALCPHTGTPVPGGLNFQQATALIAEVARSGRRIVGFDLVEVAPGPGNDEWDGNVGARILYKLIGWALAGGERAAAEV